MMQFVLILFLILLLVGEVFSFRGMQFLTAPLNTLPKYLLRGAYWLWTLTVLGLVVYAFVNRKRLSEPEWMNFAYVVVGFFLANLALKMVFGYTHLLNDAAAAITQFFSPKQSHPTGTTMSRSRFLTLSGLALASIPFSGFLYGMLKGRYRFRVIRQPLQITNLPDAFVGKKIVQISDLHLGSFPMHTDQIEKAVEKINALNPDYLFFTGDMINERAIEAKPWIDTLKRLSTKEGKYAVLGNHDYGDYYGPWQHQPEKRKQNVAELQRIQEEMGFQLLRNEAVELKQGADSIQLIGLENWGEGRFSKYGDLTKAMQGVDESKTQLLLSHDPSHWDAQVLGKTSIDVAFAGHTHGSQFGVEVPGFQWSPVQYQYPRWAGLYQEKGQQLYVNRGLGYIGYAGRVGIWPEITLFELQKA